MPRPQRKPQNLNLDFNISNLDKIPAKHRAEWKAWALVGEMLREHIDNVENNPEIFGDKINRVRAKLNRAYHDWLLSPVETFIDFDPREYKINDPAKDKRLVERLNTVSRRIIDESVLDDRSLKMGGDTGHHKGSILQDAASTRNLDAYDLYKLKAESQIQKVPLATSRLNISAQTDFSHTNKGLPELLRKYQESAHAGGDTTNVGPRGNLKGVKAPVFQPGQADEAISSILERNYISQEQSGKASRSPVLRTWRGLQEEAIRGMPGGQQLLDTLGRPLADVENFSDVPEAQNFYRKLPDKVKPNLSNFLKIVSENPQLMNMRKDLLQIQKQMGKGFNELGSGAVLSGIGLNLLQDAPSNRNVVQGVLQKDPEKLKKGATELGIGGATGLTMGSVLGKTAFGKGAGALMGGPVGWGMAGTSAAYTITDEVFKQQFGKGLKEKTFPTQEETLQINRDQQKAAKNNPSLQPTTDVTDKPLHEQFGTVLKEATAPISPWW